MNYCSDCAYHVEFVDDYDDTIYSNDCICSLDHEYFHDNCCDILNIDPNRECPYFKARKEFKNE